MMPLRRHLALILMLGLAAPAALADRLVQLTDRDDLFGWEAVGRVNISGGGYCTGTLVASNLVLTAAHCVYNNTDKLRAPSEIEFKAGLANGTALATRTVSRFVVMDNYNPHTGITANNVKTDAALLELESAIPTSLASPFVPYTRPQTGDAISVVSYGQNRDRAPSWQRECSVLWRQDGIVAFNCNVTFGSSGAPIFTDGDYRAQIVSLVVGGGKNTDGSTIAYGMHLPPVLDTLKRKLRALPPAFPKGTSSARSNKVKTSRFPPKDNAAGNHPGPKFKKP